MSAAPPPILSAIAAYEAELIALRRDIHAHPELGFEETRTSELVAGKLAEWGILVHRGLGGTGVVGTLKGDGGDGRTIGLRADMDALPIGELTGHAHASRTDGKMHACGHDGHTAMLLGAARYLSAHRTFKGTVRFIFQPAEEGLGGGRKMIEEGLFRLFPVDAVYGMHNQPTLPAGRFALRPGPLMASGDTWTVTFSGTGGHGGAGVHLSTDPTMVLGQFIQALQGIVGRNVRAVDPAVLSIGYIHAGAPNSPNVIPREVVVRGTARSFTPDVRDLLERRLGEVAKALAEASHCEATLDYIRRYPPLVNHPAQTAIAARAAAALVGEANVDAACDPWSAAEDFSFMLRERPGAFILIGNATGTDRPGSGLHTPIYDFNDGILSLGAAYWCTLALSELAGPAL